MNSCQENRCACPKHSAHVGRRSDLRFREEKLWQIHDGAVQLVGSRQCSMYDPVMMSCLIVANRVSLVLLKADLEGTSPTHAPTSTSKTVHFVTVSR
jgi:hypothetical protein